MQLPKITIIMPVYNAAQYFSDAINSVLTQTYTNWELIIINDASTDGLEKLIQEAKKKDRRIRSIHNTKNLGQTKSLNDGIALAEGAFIARIDADDIWVDKNKLEKQVRFLLHHAGYGVVGSFAYTVDNDGRKISDLTYPINDQDIKKYFLIENCFVHSSILMRKSVVDKVGKYDEHYKYAQDYELLLRIGTVSKIHNVPEYMVHYRINLNGISQTTYRKQIAETIQIVNQYRKYYKHFLLGIMLWHIRTFLPRIFRESLSRQVRKILFVHKYSTN